MFLLITSNSVTTIILAVGTRPSIGRVSKPNSIRASSKLGSGINVFWLKPNNVKPKKNIKNSLFMIWVFFKEFFVW